jgi:hypothetical protein
MQRLFQARLPYISGNDPDAASYAEQVRFGDGVEFNASPF